VPLIVREHGLIDHVSATAHGGYRAFGVGRPIAIAAVGLNRDDGFSVGAKSIEPRALVLGTLFSE
jgi:hypothetical protein